MTTATLARAGYVLALLWSFVFALELSAAALDVLAAGTSLGLFQFIDSPLSAFLAALLATALVQRSTLTTLFTIASVGSGHFDPELAVWAIMGCNVGTPITAMLIGFVHSRYRVEFERCFSGAATHLWFNITTAILLLPIEYFWHPLSRLSDAAARSLFSGHDAAGWISPVRASAAAPVRAFVEFLREGQGLESIAAGLVMMTVTVVVLIAVMTALVRTSKNLVAGRAEDWLGSSRGRHLLEGTLIGMVFAAAVQSSSLVTSLMVPLYAAGVVSLRGGLPLILGANIGTTIAPILAASATNVNGVAIAFVHVFFNLFGVVVTLAIAPWRRLILALATLAGRIAARSTTLAILYVAAIFILVPILGIFVLR